MTNTINWFQVGSNEPEQAKSFYGALFGWTFVSDPENDSYDLVRYPGSEIPVGGIAHTEQAAQNHAVVFVEVANVGATVAEAERLGAKVVVPPITSASGLTFAHLADVSGNEFGVYSSPAA
ncbi:VOC family protein [Nocardia altamirensis]|uniref:VOC family protein n=1 Tax=Nocardia altamirensis TaxID=472158 RepID=UPI000840430E|nr:VOC family protein [Nocardia altamirensis]